MNGFSFDNENRLVIDRNVLVDYIGTLPNNGNVTVTLNGAALNNGLWTLNNNMLRIGKAGIPVAAGQYVITNPSGGTLSFEITPDGEIVILNAE